ncbi:RNA-binding E3 ubiquitin-protein like [Actinidia chinensis var. chinensis]|uniref:RNA-binding E3 ubiquitin-protein like n=1 Tax=Actinidia chinensis var. chinensis TaxID=1590841 RepID=A0A2R6R5G1_ACTCC|nr:RNA-binding E3 ubiquitin-protein like [Actinidia chinensis var. chinensis]
MQQKRNRVIDKSSTVERHSSLKLLIFSTQHAILSRPNELQGDHVESDIPISLVTHMFVYFSILAALVMILYLIFKYLGYWSNHASVEQMTPPTETNHLIPNKAVSFTYGTCEEDLESGKCTTNSSDDLYDGKICIICYDEQRSCFFVPCGHCATCHCCAQRIMEEESKMCPVCRRFIHRVKKLFTLQNQTDG